MQHITNNELPPDLREQNHLFFKNNVIARLRQASDYGTRIEVHKCLTKLHKQIKAAEQYPRTKLDLIEKGVLDLLGASYEPSEYSTAIGNMNKLCGENAKLFAEVMNSEV